MKRMYCDDCKDYYDKKYFSKHLLSDKHKVNASSRCGLGDDTKIIAIGFKNRLKSYIIENKCSLTVEDFLKSKTESLQKLLKSAVEEHHSIKVHYELYCNVDQPGKEEKNKISLKTKVYEMFTADDYDEHFEEVFEEIKTKGENFEIKGSGWAISEVNYLQININKYNPIRGSSYLELPESILKRKAIINIKNNDPYCFLWSLTACIHSLNGNEVHHSDRTSSYPHFENIFKYKDFKFPMTLSQIRKFEKVNDFLSINVFGLKENSIIGPLYKCQEEKKNHCNLLLIQKGEKFHYAWIKNLSRAVGSQISKTKARKFLCNSCLIDFKTQNKLDEHRERNDCFGVITILPSEENAELTFKDYNKCLKLNFAIYADTECVLEKISPIGEEPSSNKKSKTSTTNIHKHVAAMSAYKIVCEHEPLSHLCNYKEFSGEKCMENFVDSLVKDVKHIASNYLRKDLPMEPLSRQQKMEIEMNTKACKLCLKDLGENFVYHHDHLTQKFIGLLHNECNLKLKKPNFINVIYHNLQYDGSLLIRELAKIKGETKVIPINKERFIAIFKKIQLEDNSQFTIRIIDSFKFLSSSLDKLAKTLNRDQFTELSREMINDYGSDVNLDLLIRKGIFPYQYLDKFEKFNEEQLPPAEDFHSDLTGEDITEADYQHALNVWKEFNIKNLKQYTSLYLKTDIMLLSDIFQNFRTIWYDKYGLDPMWYVSLGSLSWASMLKMTGVNIELLRDPSMITMIERSIRGGVVQVGKRYAKSNNKYVEGYDTTKPDSYIVYLDRNNLYGEALCNNMPFRGFKWADPETWNDPTKICSIPDDSKVGYIFEVDLKYDEKLHDLHNDYPFCPELMKPPVESCSNTTEKLLLNLRDKTKYVCHYRTLKLCLKNGLQLLKVHRVMEFEQEAFIKPYIELNTEFRKSAKCEFEKDLWKLANNIIYGKSLESCLNKMDVKIVTKGDNKGSCQLNVDTLTSNPFFESFEIIEEDLAIVQIKPSKVFFNKAIFIGFSVLEISKTFMYDFHYNFMKKVYPNLNTLYGDTDSWIYEIFCQDFYKDILNYLDYFDTSNFSPNNIFKIPLVNGKVLGKMKLETGDKLIRSFVGLKSKMYAIDIQGDDEIKKAKGISKSVVKKLSFIDYCRVLFEGKALYSTMYRIQPIKQTPYTVKVIKKGLTNNDNKRFIIDNINSLAHFHWRIEKIIRDHPQYLNT